MGGNGRKAGKGGQSKGRVCGKFQERFSKFLTHRPAAHHLVRFASFFGSAHRVLPQWEDSEAKYEPLLILLISSH